MITHIFFDLYQTLVNVDIVQAKEPTAWKVFHNYLIEKGIKSDEAEKFHKLFIDKEKKFYYSHNINIHHHDWIDSINAVIKEDYSLKISHTEIKELMWEYRKLSCDYVHLYPKVEYLLRELNKSYILNIASLAHESIALREIKELGIQNYFTNIFFTSSIGYRKNSIEFYKHIIQKSDSSANKSVMIGDNLVEDIQIPQQLGMKTIHIRNSLTQSLKKNIFADFTVNIDNLEKIIDITKHI